MRFTSGAVVGETSSRLHVGDAFSAAKSLLFPSRSAAAHASRRPHHTHHQHGSAYTRLRFGRTCAQRKPPRVALGFFQLASCRYYAIRRRTTTTWAKTRNDSQRVTVDVFSTFRTGTLAQELTRNSEDNRLRESTKKIKWFRSHSEHIRAAVEWKPAGMRPRGR